MALKRWEPTKGMEKFFEDMFEENLSVQVSEEIPQV